MSGTELELAHARRLFYEDLGMCGCGSDPEHVIILVFRILVCTPRPGTEDAFNPDRYDWLNLNAGAAQLILGLLTNADLLEHGGAIEGSWLTNKGVYYRATLGKLTWDEIEVVDGPHGGLPCKASCWVLTEDQKRTAPGPIRPRGDRAFEPQNRLPSHPNSPTPAGLTEEMFNRALGINEPRIEVPDTIPSEWVAPLRDEADRLPRGRNPYIGCREVNGTWIHGRPHSCPISARGF